MKNRKLTKAFSSFLLAAFFLMFTTSCSYASWGEKGNGNVVKQEREVSNFSGIDVGGAFKVYLTQGDNETLVVEADENLLDLIETEVRGKTLKIWTSDEIKNSKAMNVYITFKTLDHLEVSGACNLTAENKFELGDLELDCSGASDVMLKLSAEKLDVDCSGASQVDLYGSADAMKLDLSGASKMDASDLELNIVDADVSGASHGKIFVTGELSAEVSGAANLKYKGDPTLRATDVSGAGNLRKY